MSVQVLLTRSISVTWMRHKGFLFYGGWRSRHEFFHEIWKMKKKKRISHDFLESIAQNWIILSTIYYVYSFFVYASSLSIRIVILDFVMLFLLELFFHNFSIFDLTY